MANSWVWFRCSFLMITATETPRIQAPVQQLINSSRRWIFSHFCFLFWHLWEEFELNLLFEKKKKVWIPVLFACFPPGFCKRRCWLLGQKPKLWFCNKERDGCRWNGRDSSGRRHGTLQEKETSCPCPPHSTCCCCTTHRSAGSGCSEKETSNSHNSLPEKVRRRLCSLEAGYVSVVELMTVLLITLRSLMSHCSSVFVSLAQGWKTDGQTWEKLNKVEIW